MKARSLRVRASLRTWRTARASPGIATATPPLRG